MQLNKINLNCFIRRLYLCGNHNFFYHKFCDFINLTNFSNTPQVRSINSPLHFALKNPKQDNDILMS